MPQPQLSKLELKVMEALWDRELASIRELQESFPAKKRPAYTTVQTIVNRLEEKKAIRRVRKVGNFHIFGAILSREAVQRRLVDELFDFFGGSTQPVMTHLIQSGKLTEADVNDASTLLRKLKEEKK